MLSKKQIIATVAEGLPQPFALEDLVLAAWRFDPKGFGLGKHYLSHPNSKTVEAEIYGIKGLVAEGILQKVSRGVFCITADYVEQRRKAKREKIQKQLILRKIQKQAEKIPDFNGKLCRHQLRISECATCLGKEIANAR